MTSFFDAEAPERVLKSLFSKYDTDGSGDLCQAELEILFIDDLGLTEEQASTYAMLLDADGSKSVSFDEFCKWLRSGEQFKLISSAQKSRYKKMQKAIKLFQEYDVDNSQSLNREQFKKLFLRFGGDERKVDYTLAKLDKDGNGVISFPEFLNLLKWEPVN